MLNLALLGIRVRSISTISWVYRAIVFSSYVSFYNYNFLQKMNFQTTSSYLSPVQDLFHGRSTLALSEPREKNWLSADEIYSYLTTLLGDKANVFSPNISSVCNIFSKDWQNGTIRIIENLWQLFSDEVFIEIFSYRFLNTLIELY